MVHVPKILPLLFAHNKNGDKNGDEQFWEEKLHAAKWEALHAHSKVPLFFSFWVGVGAWEGGDFFSFFLILNVFSSGSQWLSITFPQFVTS